MKPPRLKLKGKLLRKSAPRLKLSRQPAPRLELRTPELAPPKHTRFVPAARLKKVGPLSSPLATLGNTPVARPPPSGTPDLSAFDLIVVSTSGGKDSQAALDIAVTEAGIAGVLDRVVAVHADLGDDEWEGAGAVAEAQAKHYGVPFVVTSRIGQVKTDTQGTLYKQGEVFGDLNDYVRRRKAAHRRGDQASKPAWYSPAVRFCTSEFKRGPIRKATNRLIAAWRQAEHGRAKVRVRVLSVQGIRADESSVRAKREPLAADKTFSSSRREVWTWLPAHGWSARDVWATIRDSGAPHHWAYDVGMPRLSCTFCVFAPEEALALSGMYNRQMLERKVQLEKDTGDTFKANLALGKVLERVDRGDWPSVKDWTM